MTGQKPTGRERLQDALLHRHAHFGTLGPIGGAAGIAALAQRAPRNAQIADVWWRLVGGLTYDKFIKNTPKDAWYTSFKLYLGIFKIKTLKTWGFY